MAESTQISVDRYLAEPGRSIAERNVVLTAGRTGVEAQRGGAVGNGLLAMAPPVNAHDHGYGIRTLDFGCVDDALEPWIAGLRMRSSFDPYLEALVAFGRLALNGCGATMHCHNSLRIDNLASEVDDVVRAAGDCGIRVAVSCPLLDTGAWTYDGPEALEPQVDASCWRTMASQFPAYAPVAEQIDAVVDIARRKRSDLVDIQLGPIGPQWCSDSMLEAIAETSQDLDLRIHMHLLESPRQRRWLDRRFEGGVVNHLDRIGFLSPRLAVAHGVHLSEAECTLLAERGVIVVSNPSANLRLRSGIAPVDLFRRSGLNYAIGLDGTGFSDDQDIWQELRLFRLLHGGTGLEPAIPTEELFDAAIGTAARVFGQDVAADLVVLDFDALIRDALTDDLDEAEVILTRMTGAVVKALYVAGRVVVADGKLTGFDFAEARKSLAERSRQAFAQRDEDREISSHLRKAIRQYYQLNG